MTEVRRHLELFIMLAAVLLAGCSDEASELKSADHTQEQKTEITIKADVNAMHTRATTFSADADLQAQGSFTCTAYNANTTTAYIPTTTVDWNSTTSKWEFNNGSSHYYWPLPATEGGAYPSLDFFGYMPTTTPSYITTGPTYTADHNVTFTCGSLPMQSATEFIYGVATGQNYGNASAGVPLNFQHPFARITLQWANYDHSRITINSITLKNIKNNGTYRSDDSPQWTPSGADANLTVTTLDSYGTATPVYYIVVPQSWAGEIEVSATWDVWDESITHTLTTTVPTTWQPGYSHTYTFTITDTDLKVDTERFTEQW